jgi:hypothetical protein
MKAEINSPVFSPVIITLETQAELDGMCAILDNDKVMDAVGLSDVPALEDLGLPYSIEAARLHRKLTSLLKSTP